MKILITGANGLLGQKLVNLFSDENVEFLATGTGNCRLDSSYQEKYRTLDITSEAACESIINEYSPTHIVNGAAMTNVDRCESEIDLCQAVNVNAVSVLFKIASEKNIHFIHISTDFIFDGTKGEFYTEIDLPNPLSRYGHSKNDAEQFLINSHNKNWTILRTILVYGVVNDSSRSNIVLWVKNSLENHKNINVVDDQFRTPTLAEDLANSCYLAIKTGEKGIFNVSGEDYMNMYELAMLVAEHFDLDKSLIGRTDSNTFVQAAKRPPRTGFNIDKARRQLGYQPRSFKEGLQIVEQQLSQFNKKQARST
jgi:dTDP-4-dehydrorhamnose reductase